MLINERNNLHQIVIYVAFVFYDRHRLGLWLTVAENVDLDVFMAVAAI